MADPTLRALLGSRNDRRAVVSASRLAGWLLGDHDQARGEIWELPVACPDCTVRAGADTLTACGWLICPACNGSGRWHLAIPRRERRSNSWRHAWTRRRLLEEAAERYPRHWRAHPGNFEEEIDPDDIEYHGEAWVRAEVALQRRRWEEELAVHRSQHRLAEVGESLRRAARRSDWGCRMGAGG